MTAGGGALRLRTARYVIRCLHLPAVGKGLCIFLTLRAILAYQTLDKRRLPPAAPRWKSSATLTRVVQTGMRFLPSPAPALAPPSFPDLVMTCTAYFSPRAPDGPKAPAITPERLS